MSKKLSMIKQLDNLQSQIMDLSEQNLISSREITFLQSKLREFQMTGWNEARATKLRMMEVFQQRFIHILTLADTKGPLDTLIKFKELSKELKWIPEIETMAVFDAKVTSSED